MSFDFEIQYSNEWKILGFYYNFNDIKNCWQLLGSKNGLLNFCLLLKNYASNPLHNEISEHEHYGPDSYFKVVTWSTPIIKKDGIYGSLKDIQKLEKILRNKLLSLNDNDEFIIDDQYSKQNECYLLIKIMTKNFDPSTGKQQL